MLSLIKVRSMPALALALCAASRDRRLIAGAIALLLLTFLSAGPGAVAVQAEIIDSEGVPISELIVDTTSDADLEACTVAPDDCSFRGAVYVSNDIGGRQTIKFNIPGAGAKTITRTGNQWQLIDAADIDGTTQTGYLGAPIIELNGADSVETGLLITSGGSNVRGLVINRFTLHGIRIQSNANSVTNSYIGTDLAGRTVLPPPMLTRSVAWAV